MKMWLVMVFSFLSYTCDGSSVNQSTHSSVNTAYTGTDITDIKMEVDVMKGNYHDLLLRVINNEHEIVTLKGQTQQMVNELENTKRTFSCEIEDLRATTIQYEQEINETINSWNTLNETIQDLSQSVSVLENKFLILESLDMNSNEHNEGKSNESGLASEKQECPLEWIRNVDFGACYFFSSKPMSWDGAQEQCREQNGSLADIHSEDEALWMADAARNNGASFFWIGGKKVHGEYKWFTSDGNTKDMSYTNWRNGEVPPPLSESHRSACTMSRDNYQYKWFHYYCDASFINFICKTYI